MDKNAIKKYAIWARRELIEKVSQKALQYGIEDGKELDPKLESINGVLLSDDEKKQRQALIRKINENGYAHVMEEVAYTWFNRFIALRFMEVNGYLPSHVRVFTDEAGEFKPQIMSEALHLELEGLDMEKVYELKNDNRDDDLFKYLLITQCNDLSAILPKMFQKISDYTELLLPDYLLRNGSVIERMVIQGTPDSIPESDWTDQVQIIGWLYQYYNTEEFNAIYDGELSTSKVGKELIPAATQMFTPDWVVQYMVENSLGRLWLEGHPNDELQAKLKYYLEGVSQEEVTKEQLREIHMEYAKLKPQDIRVIDPCSGSGHILCVFFDLLVQIYEDYGFTAREAATSIIKNNIWGLDIDERAMQLSYFAVMMKARQYDRRFLLKRDENNNPDIPQPHIYVVCESNGIDPSCVELFVDGRDKLKSAMETIIKEMHDAKEYGSIINVTHVDFEALYARFEEMQNEETPGIFTYHAINELLPLVNVGQALAQKYNVVVTNPPYLGSGKFSSKLSSYIEKNYYDEKSDLGMVMLKRILFSLVKPMGFAGAITTVSWMFIKSFEKFRTTMISNKDFVNLVDFGTELFEGKIGHLPVAAWVNRNTNIKGNMLAIRLVDYCYSRRDEKLPQYFNHENRYTISQKELEKIPGMPLAYWISNEVAEALMEQNIGSISEARMGLTTGRNDKYLRLWQEVEFSNVGINLNREEAKQSGLRWFPYDKGGDYRKWYGNRSYVVDWKDDGHEMQTTMHPDGKRIWAHNFNLEYNFRPHISWNDVALNALSFRFFEKGFLFDSAAATTFVPEDKTYAILSYLNSDFVNELAKLLNPTVHFKLGDYSKLPFGKWDFDLLESLGKENVEISKSDWDSFEQSWDFAVHPLIKRDETIESAYILWNQKCQERFERLQENEQRIDRYFMSFYKMDDRKYSTNPVTIALADKTREIKSLISYAVGCMFGRYSLDVPGLVFTGGKWDESKYVTFIPDSDGIIPICDDEYFEDDICGRFIKFIEVVYGKENLEENLLFISNALGGKGTARDIIRSYFISDFYKDHCNAYQVTGSGKRPIYWLFDSGKKNGFKCLIYIHRYQQDTIARIRTDYVHEQQARYRTAIEEIEKRIDTVSASEKVKLTKKLNTLKAQDEEIHTYEEKIHHLADQMISIDLDDGVKANYAKFQDVLAKIK